MLVCKPSEGEFCLCGRDATCIVSISTKAVRYRDDGSCKRINLRSRVHELNRSSFSHRLGNRAQLERILVWKYSSLEIWCLRFVEIAFAVSRSMKLEKINGRWKRTEVNLIKKTLSCTSLLSSNCFVSKCWKSNLKQLLQNLIIKL